MADKQSKLPDNVPGAYYVDDQCTACGLCVDDAPDNFKMVEDNSHAFVCTQPATEDQAAKCQEALAACPADAIGDDG